MMSNALRPRSGMLTAAQEAVLVTEAKAGRKQATDRLIGAYEPLMEKMAKRFMGRNTDADDLMQEARLGMVIAIGQFEPERGFRLGTYARHWIKAQMLDHVRNTRSMMKMGTSTVQRRLAARMSDTKRKLGIYSDGTLTHDEAQQIGKILDASVEDVMEINMRLSSGAIMSLDAPWGTSDDGPASSLGDMIADPDVDVAASIDHIDHDRRTAAIAEAITRLDDRTRDIINARYLQDDSMTLKELGNRHGVSHERVRQIEARALDKIRKAVPWVLIERLAPERSVSYN